MRVVLIRNLFKLLLQKRLVTWESIYLLMDLFLRYETIQFIEDLGLFILNEAIHEDITNFVFHRLLLQRG